MESFGPIGNYLDQSCPIGVDWDQFGPTMKNWDLSDIIRTTEDPFRLIQSYLIQINTHLDTSGKGTIGDICLTNRDRLGPKRTN